MRTISSFVVVALCACLLTACVPGNKVAPDNPLTAAELSAAGILIIDDENTVPESPTDFFITSSQAEWLTTEATIGSGFVGSELDTLAPVSEGHCEPCAE